MSVSIRTRGILPLLERLEEAGHDADTVLRSVGLNPAALADKEATIPILGLDAVWRKAEQLIGPTLSLEIAARSEASTFGSLTYLITRSATVGEALRRLVTHMSALSQGLRYAVHVEGERARLQAELVGRRNPARPLHVFSLAVAHAYQRRSAGEAWALHGVELMCGSPENPAPEAAFFGVAPRYRAPTDALEFDAALLSLPYESPDETLIEILEASVDHLGPEHGEPELREQCQAAIAHALSEGLPPPDLPGVASTLSMTPRTLRRHLQDANSSFRQELDIVRARVAQATLGEEPVEAVASRLGFSDRRSFARAFERWTGMTPGRYADLARADLKSAAPD